MPWKGTEQRNNPACDGFMDNHAQKEIILRGTQRGDVVGAEHNHGDGGLDQVIFAVQRACATLAQP